MEVIQYKYGLTEHTIYPVYMDIPDNTDHGLGLEVFETIHNLFSSVTLFNDLQDIWKRISPNPQNMQCEFTNTNIR